MQSGWRKNLRFRCTGCGKCCQETVVLLTDGDVRRLVEGTQRRATEVVRFFRPDEIKMEKRHPFWIRFSTGRAVMGLPWKANGHCRFLGHNNLCTVYEHRPVTCREYPFQIVQSDEGKVLEVGLTHVVECPGEFDGKNSVTDVRKVVAWNERQSDGYVERVQAWNRLRKGPFTRPAFLRYLGV